MPDQIYSVTWNGKEKVSYVYDGLGRLTTKSIGSFDTGYSYENVGEDKTTTLVKSVATPAGTYTYTYDNIGNILSVSDGSNTTSYEYDSFNQLVRVNDERAGKTYTYSYSNGNITEKKEYAFTTGELGEAVKTLSWRYENDTWRDLLTSYNGNDVAYDEIGNPVTIGRTDLTWIGRQLMQVADENNTISYAYNGDGQRVSKTVNGTTTEYFYNGEILAGQKTGDDVIVFMYDNNDDTFGFIYNGTEYYYIKNAQNDIVAIADADGSVIANYYYDAWGYPEDITGNTEIANLNPLRYRSYYYDTESELYYLNSRYYCAEIGRFLSSDGYIQTGQGILDKNMFAYCLNNPVNMLDLSGSLPKWLNGALNIVSGSLQIAAGVMLGSTASWTGIGAVAAGLLIVNGAATITQGVGQVVNHFTKSNTLREDNIVRSSVSSVGRIVGGDPGGTIAEALYDTAITVASIYASSVAIQKSMPKAIESKIFSANNGYGVKIGNNIEMFYRNPNAAGGAGGTIFSYKGSLGKFRIDWDPAHGFHCHPPGH